MKYLFGRFELSKRDIELMELAKKYHDICDKYDDSVCTGLNEYKESIPMNPTERHKMTMNSIKTRRDINHEAICSGFSESEISNAIRNHHKFNY